MVLNGWAVAFRRYSLDCVADEDAVRQSQINIWSGRGTGAFNVGTDSVSRPNQTLPSTFRLSSIIMSFASRVGLTPSPTCQTWARWFPQGMRPIGNETGRSNCQPSSGEPMEGFLCPNVNRMAQRRIQMT